MSVEQPGSFVVGDKTFLLNGEPFVVKAAEVHYPRIPQPYWEQRIKSCKALGMNTLCIYVFWNIHEQREGQFDFTGQNDVVEFCRLAQKHGMYVIVRPGPYVCAEWEMGGLPWWLLKKKDIRLREQDPYFMERVRIFERKVGEQLAPLTIQNGGPIIMVQVENEYGSYGEDKPYISEVRDIVKASWGEEVVLFQCDWSSNFEKNGLDDLVWTMNFGTGANIDEQFARLKELRPNAPLMCSEFWSGWFDKWGARHETRPADEMVAGIDEMLSKGISFSLYMTHGGTSFGHWAGANSPGFAPDVTSYDYDAPINEYGWATEKYYKLRKVLQKYSEKPLPPEPKAPYLISIPKFELKEFAPLILGADSVVMDSPLLTMEEMDMGWGTMVYVTTLPEVETPSVLTLDEGHDYAQVYIDDKLIGSIDRVQHEKSLQLPPVHKGQELKIVVEAMGRINFGRAIKDYKGITDRVTLTAEVDGNEMTWNLKRWTILSIPDDYQSAARALATAQSSMETDSIVLSPGYYRGYFTLKKRGDTFLVMESFGKGQVYVNGYPIGRFWSIGPQQTLYVPGCWLKRGLNEVVVLDVIGPSALPAEEKCPSLFALDHPVLDKLNMKASVAHNNPEDKPELTSMRPVVSGAFRSGNGWQTVKFEQPATGRYVALQALSTHEGEGEVCVAEVYVRGIDGQRLSREPWTVKYADSEELQRGNYGAEKTYDLQESTYWRTARKSELPHLMVIDLGAVQQLSGFDYLPRAEQGAPGSMKDYKIYVW
jgi:beta-galactosidase